MALCGTSLLGAVVESKAGGARGIVVAVGTRGIDAAVDADNGGLGVGSAAG